MRKAADKYNANVLKRGSVELKKKDPEAEEMEKSPVSKMVLAFLLFVVGGSVIVPMFMKIQSGPVL